MLMTEEEFRAQFKKSPKDVVDFFKQKGVRGPEKHWDWSDTLRHANDRAFVVAKATSLDLLRDIKKSMTEAIEQGQSKATWSKGLAPKLQAKGWWGKQEVENPQTGKLQTVQLGSPRRLAVIYDANMATAYDAGNFARMMEVADDMPYWEYILGSAQHHRPTHVALAGLVFRYDDPFWYTHRPRQGFGCHCGVRNGDASDIERRTGKPLDQALVKSSPEDFNTKTVQVQGKDIDVIGYRPPGSSSFVYPQPGWDYGPGDFSWRTKQMLADKVVDLPEGAVRKAFQQDVETAIKNDFSQYLDVLQNTWITRKQVLATGVLDPVTVQALDKKVFYPTQGLSRKLDLSTPLLLADDVALAHALRDSKVAKGIAMPRELLAQLPDLLKTYELRWDKAGALLAFSPEFKEASEALRWKIVFTPWTAPQGDQLRFKTATKVGASALGLAEKLP